MNYVLEITFLDSGTGEVNSYAASVAGAQALTNIADSVQELLVRCLTEDGESPADDLVVEMLHCRPHHDRDNAGSFAARVCDKYFGEGAAAGLYTITYPEPE